MKKYHLLYVDADRVVGPPSIVEAANEAEALYLARRRAIEDTGCEVWADGRLISRLASEVLQEATIEADTHGLATFRTA